VIHVVRPATDDEIAMDRWGRELLGQYRVKVSGSLAIVWVVEARAWNEFCEKTADASLRQ
jgi:hypothetical protein